MCAVDLFESNGVVSVPVAIDKVPTISVSAPEATAHRLGWMIQPASPSANWWTSWLLTHQGLQSCVHGARQIRTL